MILGIIITVPFIIYTSLRKDEPHLILLCLNEEMELGNYPKSVAINETITLYFVVESYWNEDIEVQVRHIAGKNSTISLSSAGSINGTLLSFYNKNLNVREEWTSVEINTSFTEPLNENEHYLIIFEIWANFSSEWEFMNDQIVYIRLNATSV